MLFNTADIHSDTKEITITFIVPEKDFIYKDFITCSVDNPMITLSAWKANKQSINHYDPSFKETKQVFNEDFSISMIATAKTLPSNPVHLYCSYYRKIEKKITDTIFNFSFPHSLDTNIQINDAQIEAATEMNRNKIYSYHTPHISLEQYAFIFIAEIQHLIAFFIAHNKECFSLLIILMSLLLLFLYFYQEPLQKHKKMYEFIEVIITFFAATSIIYILIYLHTISTSFIQLILISISVIFSAITGFFYIKKSTKLQSGFLRTFCTFIGILFIISTLFMAFKTLQCADEQFNLFL